MTAVVDSSVFLARATAPILIARPESARHKKERFISLRGWFIIGPCPFTRRVAFSASRNSLGSSRSKLDRAGRKLLEAVVGCANKS